MEVLLGCFVRTPDERLNEICRKIADCLIEKKRENGEQVWKRVLRNIGKTVFNRRGERAHRGGGRRAFGRSEEENHRRLTLILEQLDDRIKTSAGRAWRKAEDLCDCQYGDGGMLVIPSDLDGRKAKQKGKKYDEREFDFKIAAVGILVTVIGQVLKHSGREEHAF